MLASRSRSVSVGEQWLQRNSAPTRSQTISASPSRNHCTFRWAVVLSFCSSSEFSSPSTTTTFTISSFSSTCPFFYSTSNLSSLPSCSSSSSSCSSCIYLVEDKLTKINVSDTTPLSERWLLVKPSHSWVMCTGHDHVIMCACYGVVPSFVGTQLYMKMFLYIFIHILYIYAWLYLTKKEVVLDILPNAVVHK